MAESRNASIAGSGYHAGSISASSDAHRNGSVISSDGAIRPALSQRNSPAQSNKSDTTRFRAKESGAHEHNISNVRHRGKSLGIVRYLKEQQMLHLTSSWMKKLRGDKSAIIDPKGPLAAPTMLEKYGKCGHVLGRGAFGTVRVSHRLDSNDPKSEQLFAVKELKQRPEEPSKKYHKRINAEFCISHALHHQNVISTLDLIQDAKGVYCQVMEYVSGGDLHTLILVAGQLAEEEADCFFKQMVRGVAYMHEMGVAHRDLKPENILLTQAGGVKIIDFGNAECFRTAWETEAHLSAGICGSAPYIAPEEYTAKEFDSRAVDVWACGTIYMAMRTGQYLWRTARPEKDEEYKRYVADRKTEEGYAPIEGLRRRACRNVVYSTLDPSPMRRLTAHQVLASEWAEQIHVCHAGSE